MYKTKSKISIFVALMLLCSGGFGADAPNDSVEDYPAWQQKRYMPDPVSTENLIGLNKDYFAEYFEAQAKIFTEIAKKVKEIKDEHGRATESSSNYKEYLDSMAIFLSAIKGALGEPLEDPIIKVNMMRQLMVSNRVLAEEMIQEAKNKKLKVQEFKVLEAQEDSLKGDKNG
jgi:hypothetical protein